MTSKERVVFKSRSDRFWFLLLPATILYVVAQFTLARWALRVFSPAADPELRYLVGYGAPLLALAAVMALVGTYLAYGSRSFEFMPKGLLVRSPLGEHLMRWEDVLVTRSGSTLYISDGEARSRVHKFFLPEFARLSELVEIAHRKRRSTLNL